MTGKTALLGFAITVASVSAAPLDCCAQDAAQPQPESVPALKDVFAGHFKIGSAINRGIVTGKGFRRSSEEVQADIALVVKHFNHVVAENDMKWQMIHPRPGEDGYDFSGADAVVRFAEDNGMELAGHTLVWHSQTPNWVFEGTQTPQPGRGGQDEAPGSSDEPQADGDELRADGDEPRADGDQRESGRSRREFGGRGGPRRFRGFDLNGPRASREELLERMREHIHTVVGRYKGQVKVWDVVNEAIADDGDEVLRRSPWSVIIGPDFIAKAFEYAHEADPDAILRYNDYGLEDPEKRGKLVTLIKELQEQNVPVMAIGSQAHCNVTMTFETMDAALTEMAALGLPIHITELDVNSAVGGQRRFGADIAENSATTQGGLVVDAENRLANAYTGIFQAFVKHQDSIDVVTFWGPNDANSWRSRGRPLLFDRDSQPKPAFFAVVKTVGGSR